MNEKPCFDLFLSVLARDGILLLIFVMRMTRLDVVNEWKLIRKFKKWLYNLHMNPITTRRNVKSDFRIQPRNVIVREQKTVSTEYKKCGISEDLNQNDDRIISRKLVQYHRFFADINHQYIYVFTTRTDRLKIVSAHVVF